MQAGPRLQVAPQDGSDPVAVEQTAMWGLIQMLFVIVFTICMQIGALWLGIWWQTLL